MKIPDYLHLPAETIIYLIYFIEQMKLFYILLFYDTSKWNK
jgi:hypothetical protein